MKLPPVEPLPPLRPPSPPNLAEQARQAGHELSDAARALTDAAKSTATKPSRGTVQPEQSRLNGVPSDGNETDC